MRILIDQPGKVGDIINGLPIAKWYADQGHDIWWLCPEKYHSLFGYVDYVNPIAAKPYRMDRLIDLSFGLKTGTSLHRKWLQERAKGKSFVTFKYELAEVPITELRNLKYNRDAQAEEELYEIVTGNIEGPYNLCHRFSDYGTHIRWPDGNGIDFTPKSHYSIFDWREVIENATELHCIDSSLVNFADSISTDAKRYYYITDRVPLKGDRTILTKTWTTINTLEYVA